MAAAVTVLTLPDIPAMRVDQIRSMRREEIFQDGIDCGGLLVVREVADIFDDVQFGGGDTFFRRRRGSRRI